MNEICSKCKELPSKSDHSYCLSCHREYTRNSYHLNKENQRNLRNLRNIKKHKNTHIAVVKGEKYLFRNHKGQPQYYLDFKWHNISSEAYLNEWDVTPRLYPFPPHTLNSPWMNIKATQSKVLYLTSSEASKLLLLIPDNEEYAEIRSNLI